MYSTVLKVASASARGAFDLPSLASPLGTHLSVTDMHVDERCNYGRPRGHAQPNLPKNSRLTTLYADLHFGTLPLIFMMCHKRMSHEIPPTAADVRKSRSNIQCFYQD